MDTEHFDAGCGSGGSTLALAQRFDQVVGIDISEPLIDIARRRGSGHNVRYHLVDLMAFADADKFDLVFSSTTLHHLPDLDAALLHLKSLVRAGGTVMLIDNVATRPTPSRLVHVLGAVWHFPGDVARRGWARRLVAAQISDRRAVARPLGKRSLSLTPAV